MFDRPRLLQLFRERALKFGDFTLASGKKAKYYLDGKQITLHSEGLRLVSQGLLELMQGVECSAVGGMSIGADPIVAGILTVAAEQGKSLDGFLVRKESKGHGTQKYVEGPIQPGDKVVIVEDVVTTGGSSILAVDRVREFGAEVVLVLAIIDRMEGGRQNFADKNLPFQSLLTIEDFGLQPPQA
ncbi:orotate phosphoribosyltransferase [Planctomyces sp. SH-PL14]|jgi:orotate phosphoribosyltransferase|uniref:orotate phosphoribosyltransferase n=1 Tax=Planctomyces sp. SH-PL14 TaxID=1632864 RepID=UPI00078E5176|nr:orotate phosphoribosyltransferase [Planctomyces sp. SH-PL14]AMV17256.1 Orotate phosphoribosyltransferase [Planctomyces sp. SH-PL14]